MEYRKINKIAIVGMGALGIMYGDFFSNAKTDAEVSFLVDDKRAKRYAGRTVLCNGRECSFQIESGTEPEQAADLLIFAVKATALEEAIRTAGAYVGENTVILSVLNGISSEEIIGDALGHEHMLYCVAQGMDAVKLGNELTYAHMGQLYLGYPKDEPEKEVMLRAVTELFDSISFPYTVEEDIMRRLWCKWMLNVGVNQVVMVTEGNYGTVQRPGEARDMMMAAMREVILLAECAGVSVTDEDLDGYMKLTDTLNPEGMPSMRQDGIEKRASEVELFAGTVIRKAEQYGIDVPVNRKLYRSVKEMEAQY